MELEFRTKNDKQLQACEYWIDEVSEQILFGGGKGGGKSYLGCSLIFGDALIYPDTHYFIARGELTDLRKFTIPSIHEVFKNWGLNIDDYATFDGQYNIFNLKNGSKVFLIACKELPSDPLFERFGSMQMTRGWIEEAGEVAESAKANLWLSVGRWKNDVYNLKKKLFITANPKKNWMKRDFIDLWKDNRLPPSRKFIQSLATDNPYLPQDYINTLSQEKDQVRRQRLFLGDWDYEEDKDSLINSDALSDAFSNSIIKDGQKYITADVARFGDDSTVIAFWDGLELYKIERYQKQAITVTLQKLKDLASAEKIPYSNILIDEDGIGGGVLDGMFGAKGFVANSTALPTASQIQDKLSRTDNYLIPKINFANLKSQCAYKLAELINEHKIRFDVIDYREAIIEDVSALLRKKSVDSDGKLTIKPKEDVKKDLGRSPDIGDVIIYRAWFELRKDTLVITSQDKTIILKQNERFMANKNNFSKNEAQ